MTLAGLTLPGTERASRWLLITSLALNLFFIGAGVALLLQGEFSAAGGQAIRDHSLSGRIERIAARLPQADAAKLRVAYRSDRGELDQLWATYRSTQDGIRAALRADPFQVDALRAAMARMRSARQLFDTRIQDFFATVASQMSPAGRQKLADWPRHRRSAGGEPKQTGSH